MVELAMKFHFNLLGETKVSNYAVACWGSFTYKTFNGKIFLTEYIVKLNKTKLFLVDKNLFLTWKAFTFGGNQNFRYEETSWSSQV